MCVRQLEKQNGVNFLYVLCTSSRELAVYCFNQILRVPSFLLNLGRVQDFAASYLGHTEVRNTDESYHRNRDHDK